MYRVLLKNSCQKLLIKLNSKWKEGVVIVLQLKSRLVENSEAIIKIGDKLGYLCGYIEEACFLKKYKESEYSTDWWIFPGNDKFGKNINGNPIFVVFKDFDDLNCIDLNLIHILRNDASNSKKYACILVMIENDKFCVYDLDVIDDKIEKKLIYSIEFNDVKINSFKDTKYKEMLEKRNTKEEKSFKNGRYCRAIKLIKEKGLLGGKEEKEFLEKRALQIFKQESFNKYHGLMNNECGANLDIIGKDDKGRLIYYEVKFKPVKSWTEIGVNRAEVCAAGIFNEKKMLSKNVVLCNLDSEKGDTLNEDKKWDILLNLLEKKSIDQLSWVVADFDKLEGKGTKKRYDKDRKKFNDVKNNEEFTHFFYPLTEYDNL